MRVIDVDAIQYDRLLKTGNKEHPLEWAVSQSLINSMPTIKVEPKHGKWKTVQYGCVCSVCGKRKEQFSDNFCANCGAKMDEVEE